MEAMLKISLIPHQIYILLHISSSICRSDLSVSFIINIRSRSRVHLNPQMRETVAESESGPNPAEAARIGTRTRWRSESKSSFIPARISCCYSLVPLTHIQFSLTFWCGFVGLRRERARDKGGARGSGGRVLAEDDTVQHTAAHTCDQMYIMYVCYSRSVLFALMRTVITWRLMKESRLQEEFPWKQRCSTEYHWTVYLKTACETLPGLL